MLTPLVIGHVCGFNATFWVSPSSPEPPPQLQTHGQRPLRPSPGLSKGTHLPKVGSWVPARNRLLSRPSPSR